MKEMKTLYLYPAERSLLEQKPQDIRAEFSVEEETLDFNDSEERMRTRLLLTRLHDKRLLEVRDAVLAGAAPEDVTKDLPVEEIEESDLAELFFALGPTVLSTFIVGVLATAQSDTAYLSLAALSDIRHALLRSFASR